MDTSVVLIIYGLAHIVTIIVLFTHILGTKKD